MTEYVGIYVGDKTIFAYRNREDQEVLHLFMPDEMRHLTGTDALRYATVRWDHAVSAEDSNDLQDLEMFVYTASAGVLKDRLDVLGVGTALVQAVFERERKDFIERTEGLVQIPRGAEDIKYITDRVAELQQLRDLDDYDTWMRQLATDIAAKRTSREDEDEIWSYDKGPLELLSEVDQRISLRAILEHIDENEPVTFDLTGIVSAWLDEHGSDRALREGWEVISGRPIVITEGTYDAQVLQAAIEILKPHLASYIRFLDYDFRNEGGVAAAISILKSFAAAGIEHRIVALLDNDSAAYEAVTTLRGIKLPPYYTIIHYPDIAIANEYPTLGPQGNVEMNVNRLAGSIELYLGTDVLWQDAQHTLMPVQWKGYLSKIQRYQGELLQKRQVQEAFAAKLKEARADRSNIAKQDWSGLQVILDTLIQTLSDL